MAHHLMRGGYRGMGMKNSDDMCVPLCHTHHSELHGAEEVSYLSRRGVDDAPALAADLYKLYCDKRYDDALQLITRGK